MNNGMMRRIRTCIEMLAQFTPPERKPSALSLFSDFFIILSNKATTLVKIYYHIALLMAFCGT